MPRIASKPQLDALAGTEILLASSVAGGTDTEAGVVAPGADVHIPVTQLAEVLLDPDDTLAGDSDAVAPTQQAVKAFVENQVAGVAPTILQVIAIAFSDESTAITVGTNKVKFRNPYATVFNVVDVLGSLSTAQASGSIFTLDINEGGTSILSTKLTIDNGETIGGSNAGAGSATPAVVSDAAIAAFAEISVDVDQVGDGTAKGGKVYLIGYPSL